MPIGTSEMEINNPLQKIKPRTKKLGKVPMKAAREMVRCLYFKEKIVVELMFWYNSIYMYNQDIIYSTVIWQYNT